ncbi:MAG TPA: type II toxin-antitoxin system VapC family toxin [Solirubrobacterales bacterium]|nr:type II toxin-antitoxin system VapC family toxin [Solirubrobacterales bacterium]
MIILDASVLIGHLDGNDLHHERARTLLEESGASPLGASPISLAETLVAPARTGQLEAARDALERIGIAELEFRADAPARLARLRADTGRKLPDCCVLLAAQDHEGTVASFDMDLLKAARTLGLAVA